jgi:Holliday junction resolvase RusA-like endonuclease
MERTVKFFVAGIPQSRGSKRGFAFKRSNGKLGVSMADSNVKSKDWMGVVSHAAQEAMGGRPPLAGPVGLRLTFTMPRPKGHYGTGRNASVLKPSAPKYHASAPDRLKLARGVEDALTGIAYGDDSQTVCGPVEKVYGDRPGVEIELTPMGELTTQAGGK